MVTVCGVFTSKCVTGKLKLPCPALIVTEAGTVATFLFELSNLMVSGFVEANPFIETNPVTITLEPPTTVLGVTETDPSVAGVMVSTTVSAVPFKLALIVAMTFARTAFVDTLKVAENAPAGIFIVPGTVA